MTSDAAADSSVTVAALVAAADTARAIAAIEPELSGHHARLVEARAELATVIASLAETALAVRDRAEHDADRIRRDADAYADRRRVDAERLLRDAQTGVMTDAVGAGPSVAVRASDGGHTVGTPADGALRPADPQGAVRPAADTRRRSSAPG